MIARNGHADFLRRIYPRPHAMLAACMRQNYMQTCFGLISAQTLDARWMNWCATACEWITGDRGLRMAASACSLANDQVRDSTLAL
jgi:hypothetical protein